jgi:hypothetical protein
MVMMNVRAMHVRVPPRVMSMSMAMLADHGDIVMMIVVSIVVTVSVLVVQRLVHVAVGVLLRQVEVDPDTEQQRGAAHPRPRRSVAEQPRHGRLDEGRDRENGSGTPRTITR